MVKKEIILVGGGGHCKSCIEVIESSGEYEIAGIVDVEEKIGEEILNYKILGSDNDLKQLREKYNYAMVTIGQIKSAVVREKLFFKLKELNYNLPVIKASTAYVSQRTKIDEGSIIMHHAIVNADAEIGKNVIINSKALVEHDCKIGNHSHISTNSTINGSVLIGAFCFVGSNACINHRIEIIDNVVIGANSTVANNITEPGVYVGSIAKKVNNE